MKHIARSTLIIAVFFGLEKVLGFVRQIIIGRTFQLSTELDAFNAANNIPDMLFTLISGGALAMALIPVLSDTRETEGSPAAWEIFSQIANFVFLVTASLSTLVGILSFQLVKWEIGIAPGFDAQQQVLVADLMRLNLFATLLFSLGGLVVAGLQSHQHFLLPAIAPSMYDIGALVGVLVFAPEEGIQLGPLTLPALGMGIHGLVYGVILGSALYLAIQLPGLSRFQFRWRPRLNFQDPGVRRVLRLMAPRVLTVFFIQLIFISQDNLASRLPTGSVTALVYGWLFMQVPETLIGTALGVALLPTLSEQISRQARKAFHQTLETAVRVIIALSIPCAVILAIGLPAFVEVLNFGEAGTNLVVWTSRAYIAGILGHALLEVGSRAFYAQHNAKTPMIASGLTVVVFLVLGITLAPKLGAPGIGIANTLAFSGEAILLLYLIYRAQPQKLQLRSTLARVTVGTILGGGLTALLLYYLPLETAGSLLKLAVTGGVIVLGGLVCLPFIWKEIKALISM
jgi:putative peptidoglycan lipid II flippase